MVGSAERKDAYSNHDAKSLATLDFISAYAPATKNGMFPPVTN